MAMSGQEEIMLWPGWETVRVIGRGSFGAVYEIERDVFGSKEKAALKVISIPANDNEIQQLREEGFDDGSITATFREQLTSMVQEYSLMRRLNGNTNVVNCDDLRYIQHDDGIGWDLYIKMELLTPMISLGTTILDEESVTALGLDMCRALALCEKHNIIHRDIKPANIFISREGSYKLGDFGVSKTIEMTMGGTKTGTYDYMAPEVYNNRPYGHQADIYSLGMVMYWMLNDRRGPFLPPAEKAPTLKDKESARNRRFAGEPLPPPAHGSEALKKIVLTACAYDNEVRYHSAAEMLEALISMISVQNDADGGSGSEKKERQRRNWRKEIVVSAVILGVVIVALALVPFIIHSAKYKTAEALLERGQYSEALAAFEDLEKFKDSAERAAEVKSAQAEKTQPPENAQIVQPKATAAPVNAVMASFSDDSSTGFWGQNDHDKSEIVKITFQDSLHDQPGNAWDVSENHNGSVMAWVKDGELTVAANGKVICNEDASGLFEKFTAVSEIDFGHAFDTANVTDMGTMFEDCSSLTALDLSEFETHKLTNMCCMFDGCSKLRSLDLSGFHTSNVTNMGSLFGDCSELRSLDLSSIDTSSVTTMVSMFKYCSSLESVDLSGFDTSGVTSMSMMFFGCEALKSLDLSCFSTSNVTDMFCMFAGCSSLTSLNVSGFDTALVTDMQSMFASCKKLTSLDLSSFNTANVTEMKGMFYGCANLTSLDLSSFNTGNVTNMEYMFQNCTELTDLNISSFDMSNAATYGMFQGMGNRYELCIDDVSWTEAVERCESMGGHLVVISDAKEFDEVSALAKSSGIPYVWVGCKRIDGEMVWITGEDINYYPWAYGEPSYMDPGDGVAEDHLLLCNLNGWCYIDSRDDPIGDYPWMYSGKVAFVCEFGG